VSISFPSSPVAGTSIYAGGRQWTYNGTSWNLVLGGAFEFQWTYTAVGGETTLTGLSDAGTTLTYQLGNEEVYLNGVKMQRNVDYTATTGTSIVFAVALAASDVVSLLSFSTMQLASNNIAQSTEPSTYTPGMVWVNTAGSAQGYTFTRWRLSVASSTSTLSGTDDNSTSLLYTPGYEEVYINGALITRGLDYTATNGTSISLTVGVVSGDVVEVINQNTMTSSLAIPNTTTTTKGDLIVGTGATGSSAVTRLPVGSNNYVLTADSSQTNGLNWEQYPPSGTSLPTGLYAGQMFYLTTANALYIYNGTAWTVLTPSALPSVSGGTLYSDSTYYYRAFTSTGNLVVSNASLTADILVVAGGGGTMAGGGGAGGLLTFSSQSISTGTYTCTIGSGGAGVSGNSAGAGKGVNSQFGALTAAIGGGAGGGAGAATYKDGGSGGGAGDNGAAGTYKGLGTSGQGNDGGEGVASSPYPGGGGGGAGGAGTTASGANSAGNGGIGATSALINAIGAATGLGQLSGGNYYFAGGGGASFHDSGTTPGTGGLGGGGNGANGNGTNGTANTGGGAGGGLAGSATGGTGGSGIIIVRYTRSQVGG